jgi:arylsulfatase A-like enzyme
MRIIYCDVDTLRPDHLEPYGYGRRITPNLRELAERGVVFDHYYASDSPCAPARAAWTTQQFGLVTGAIGNAGEAAQLRTTRGRAPFVDNPYPYAPFLGEYLSRKLWTTSISCFPPRHEAYWWVGNFREWIRPSLSLGDDEDAATVNRVAFEWLCRHADQDDWFLHLHYWDSHTPYTVGREWVERAEAAGPPPDWPDEAAVAAHQTVYGPHTAQDLYEDGGAWRVPPPRSPRPATMPDAIRTREDAVRLITGYDAAIMYWDYHFGQLLNLLSDLHRLEDTAVIVSADHGECLGEHGVYGDHPLATEAVHHIPLIIYWPGLTDRLPAAARRSGAWQYADRVWPYPVRASGMAGAGGLAGPVVCRRAAWRAGSRTDRFGVEPRRLHVSAGRAHPRLPLYPNLGPRLLSRRTRATVRDGVGSASLAQPYPGLARGGGPAPR